MINPNYDTNCARHEHKDYLPACSSLTSASSCRGDKGEFDTVVDEELAESALVDANQQAIESNSDYDRLRRAASFERVCGVPPKLPLFSISINILTWAFFLYGAIDVLRVRITLTTPVSMPPALYQFQVVGPWPSCLDYRMQVWRLLSFQFSHEGLNHIGGNTMTGLLFGALLESSLPGTSRFSFFFTAAIYQLGGIVLGAIAWAYVSPFGDGLVGCSSGVFAVLGAGISNIIINSSRINPLVIYLHLAVTFIILILSAVTFFTRYSYTTAYEAHAMGLIAGFLLGLASGIFHEDNEWILLRGYTYLIWAPKVKWRFVTGVVGLVTFLVITIVAFYDYAFAWPPGGPSWNPMMHSSQIQSCCGKLYSTVAERWYSSIDEAKQAYVCNGDDLIPIP